VKYRLMQPDPTAGREASNARDAVIWTLRTALRAILQLFAPYLPHITEAIFLDAFAERNREQSIHLSRWPDAGAFPMDATVERVGTVILEVIEAVRRWKAERNLSVGAPVAQVTIRCEPTTAAFLQDMCTDLRSITRADTVVVETGDALEVLIVPAREQAERDIIKPAGSDAG
jgi:valyl-tRNA synthetase